MCFSARASLVFAAIAIGVAAFVWRRPGSTPHASLLLVYFAIMEVIQAAQYGYLEEPCPRLDGAAPNALNQYLMALTYVHVTAQLQPLAVNCYAAHITAHKACSTIRVDL
eukprot:364397-Chlamydomonas_euryale.AAC.31